MAEPVFYDPSSAKWAADQRLLLLAKSRLCGARPWSADDLVNWTTTFYGLVVPNVVSGVPAITQPADYFPQVPGGQPKL
jgi:hypothetical protein